MDKFNTLKVIGKITLEDIQKLKMERSFYRFFLEAYKVLEPSNPLIDNWHIEYLCNELQSESERIARKEKKVADLIINIPPRSLKSHIVTRAWNAWTWIKNPQIKYITSSFSADLATEHTQDTRTLIESDWYQSRWGHLFRLSDDQNTKSKFSNDKRGSRRSTSVSAGITGAGSDIIIADDPIKVQDAHSQTARQNTIIWWTQTMFTRLDNPEIGLRVVIMQRLHENDLTGYLLNSGSNYRIICLPATGGPNVSPSHLIENYDKNNGYFFPKRFTPKFLDEAKTELGSLAYAGQYDQRPAPDEGEIIKREWLSKRFHHNDLPADIVRDFWIDTAYGEDSDKKSKKGYDPDYNSVICYSKFGECLYIWNIWRNRLQYHEFIPELEKYVFSQGYTDQSRIYVEPKTLGKVVFQQFQQEMKTGKSNLNVIADESPTASKEARLRAATPKIEAGAVSLLANSDWISDFIDECIQFPNSKHDDQVDCLSAAIRITLLGKKRTARMMVKVF